MSSFLYGRIENKREAAAQGTSTSSEAPGLKTYIDAFVALVPAEVLAAHALFVSAWTNTTKDTTDATVTVTDHHRGDFKLVFYLLLAAALLLYLAGHLGLRGQRKHFDRWDLLRMLIRPAAFAGWTMGQRPATMFDAAISLSDGTKLILVVFGGVGLGIAAALLGIKANNEAAR
jgi:hypothetical protein